MSRASLEQNNLSFFYHSCIVHLECVFNLEFFWLSCLWKERLTLDCFA